MCLRLPARAAFAALGLGTLLLGKVSLANPAVDFVRIVVVASDEDDRELEATLAELLARLDLRIRMFPVSRAGEQPPPIGSHERARIWIDMQSGPDIVVRVATVRGDSLGLPTERRIERSDARPIRVEEAAEVAYDTLESLLASDPNRTFNSIETPSESGFVAIGAPPGTTVAATHRTAHRRPHLFGLNAVALATSRSVSSRAPVVPGGGAAIETALGRGPGHATLWLSVAFNAPFDTQTSNFTLETSITCLRAVPSLEVAEWPWMRLDAGIGAGVDILRIVPRDVRSPFTGPHTGTSADSVVTAQVILRTALSTGAGLILTAAADYDASPRRDRAIGEPRGATSAFRPWSLRPALLLGLCIPLSGESACVTPQ